MLRFLAGFLCLMIQAHAQLSLTLNVTGEADLEIRWPEADAGYALEQTANLGLPAQWTPVANVPVLQDGRWTVAVKATAVAQFFRLVLGVATTTIETTSPYDGENEVTVTRESILRFSAPLENEAAFNTANFYAMSAGRKILSRAELSSDRRQLTLFYLEPLPGGSQVDVYLDPEDLFDERGRLLDPESFDEDHRVLSFTTLGLTPLATSAVVGTVYAAELDGTEDKPLAGVTITVDGMEQTLRAVTDVNGNFTVKPVPPGKFFVHIDGRTLVNDSLGIRYPDKAYYPAVGKAWEAVAGREDNLAGGTGKIYLPLIVPGTLQPVSQTQPTTISFPAGVVASNPELTGVNITVPANALFNDNGTRGGKVGIAPVAPDRLPGPLPPGLELPIVITVQTDGALNFDRPAPVCFPNVTDPVLGAPLPAGSKQALMSFNHKKGEWEAVGTMTVSADGKLVCSDAGSGIVQPGWHGVGPPPGGPPPPPCPDGGPEGASAFAASSEGHVHALETEAECKEKCAKTLEDTLKTINETEIRQLGSCVKNAPNHICPYIKGITEANELDRKIAKDAFNECIKKCANRPPPMPPPPPPKRPPKKPKKPKACRPTPKNVSGLGFARALAQTSPVIIEQIDAIMAQVRAAVAPYVGSSNPLPAAVEKQVADLVASADALAGGDAAAYHTAFTREVESQAAQAGTLEEPSGNAPDYPVLYVAEVLRPSGSFFLRGETEPFGQFQLFVPRDGNLLSVRFYDPLMKSYGIVFPRLRANPPWLLPSFELFELDASSPDADGDGLPDAVELVYGSDPQKADSDGDGIPDGVETDQGTNLLDGRPAQTGVIATIKTPGPTIDVAVSDDLVLTAEGSSGLSLLSAYNGKNPVLLSHWVTGGDVRRVALAAPLALVAQPDLGFSVIDFSTVSAPVVLYGLSLPGAQAIATDGISAYVGSSAGLVHVIDITGAYNSQQLSLTNAINDVAVTGGYLYALTDNRLFAISLKGNQLQITGSALSPFTAFPNRRLFVGGGMAYTTHARGFNSFDLSDPGTPVLLGAGNTAQVGWRHLVSNGSGLGLAAVGPNSSDGEPRDLSLYDLNNRTNTDVFIAQLSTPGEAEAIALYNGLAYVADRSAGLQVMNFLASDDKSVPPTITLVPGFSTNSTGADELVENSYTTVLAQTADDVQVRNVEFYIDGELVRADGTFPFEVAFTAPPLLTNKNSFTLQAKATDTGGNAAWSQMLTVAVRPDSGAPEVSRILPRSVAAGVNKVSVFFSEEIDPTSLGATALILRAAGPDGLAGTADDVVVTGGNYSLTGGGRVAVLSFVSNLPLGSYQIVVGTGFTDLRGNHLAAPMLHNFRVVNAVYWTGAGSGNWHDAFNWSTGRLPGSNDDVIIAAEVPSVITFRQGESTIRSLISEDRLLISGGRLALTGELQATDLELSGGTLATTRIGPNVKRFRAKQGTLDNVTIDGSLILENSDQIRVINGLTVNGKLTLASTGSFTGMYFVGAQVLKGTGEIIFGETSNANFLSPNAELRISPEFTLRGAEGYIGEPSVPLLNQGSIIAEVNGKLLRVRGQILTNEGTIELKNGAALALEGSWVNQGTLRMTGGTLSLLGNFTTAGMGTVQRSGGTISLQGVLNNTNAVFTLNLALGDWVLEGGTIQSGRIRTEGGATLRLKSGVLDGVTLDSDFTLQNADQIRVLNGLTVNARLTLSASTSFTGIYPVGPQTIGGTGELFFEGTTGLNFISFNSTLTLGSGFLIHGVSGAIGDGSFPLVNEGTIRAEGNGQNLRIGGKAFTNKGLVEASPGATIALLGEWSNEGTFKLSDSQFVLAGSFSTAGIGNLENVRGTNRVQGILNNTNATLTVDGTWTLDGGTIQGGSILASGAGFSLRNGTLDGVTLNSDLILEDADRIRVVNGLTLNKKLTLASVNSYTGIYLQGTQMLGGSGELILAGSSALNFISPNAAWTIGPGLTVHGRSGTLGETAIPLINEGTIIAEVSGQELKIQGQPLSNEGTMEARNGGIVTLNGQWVNEGLIKATDSALNLAGSFSTAGIGDIQQSGGTINLLGELNNTNSTFALNATLGAWVLDGGTIVGGTITTGSGGALRLKSGVLDGVTLDSDFGLENGEQIRVVNGLTVNQTLSLAGSTSYTGIYLQGAQTLGGTGDVLFSGSSALNFISPNAAWTIGTGLTVHGRSGTLGESAIHLTNQGTILADVADGTIIVRGIPFTNSGTTNSLNGGKLLVNP